MLRDHEGAVEHKRLARSDVQQERSRDGLAIERCDRRLQNPMTIRVEFERQCFPSSTVGKRRAVVQRQSARLMVQLQHELLDELATDDAIDSATQRVRQFGHRQRQRQGLGKAVEADQRPRGILDDSATCVPPPAPRALRFPCSDRPSSFATSILMIAFVAPVSSTNDSGRDLFTLTGTMT
jgi:hypothetical protein